ncbi:MAG TPA: tripartite tricarboxylate transporter substrate binding protein [Ramlibacter sp.]|nr:tripartite tricarboxylate transporter substrate binding protein [Ramlibacter sp.]
MPTHCALLLAVASMFAVQATAQEFPTKVVRLIVPYAPGGPIDTAARGFAEHLSRLWKKSVVIDNRPGANEVIAADFVAKSETDGHTILFATDSTFSMNPLLFKKLPYDHKQDLVPVTRVAFVNMALLVDGSLPVNNMAEFVSLIRANPGKYNYGSAGGGPAANIHFDAFLRANGLSMTVASYKGIAPAIQDLLGGRIHAMMSGISAVTPYLGTGKVKVLGVNGTKRAKSIPDVPTFTQAGFPKLEAYFYLGLAVPKGTPPAVIDQISSAARKVLAEPAFAERTLDPFAFEPLGETPKQFADFLLVDRARAEKKIRDAGIQPN